MNERQISEVVGQSALNIEKEKERNCETMRKKHFTTQQQHENTLTKAT